MNILNAKYLSQVAGGCYCACYETEAGYMVRIDKGKVINDYKCVTICLAQTLHYYGCSSDPYTTPVRSKMKYTSNLVGSESSSSSYSEQDQFEVNPCYSSSSDEPYSK